MANRLATESSPYLRQHADNPVDWQPWGSEALGRARELDRPILLSIGYSACHWCHVMAHESFEDEETARLMNERYVCIKVDREEMPDVDQIYQQALQLQGEHGGWPLTMFLTPDGVPYYGGTYFPPQDRFGRPSFQRVLIGLSDAWTQQRDAVEANARQFRDGLSQLQRHARTTGAQTPPSDAVDRAAARLAMRMDRRLGGLEGAPKFPNPKVLELLLRAWRRADRRSERDARESADARDLLDAVTVTLRRMADGGIYDHLGGGFARYSTDERWLVPHFEKMLYDNAQLLVLYAEAFQVTGDPAFERILRETVAYLDRDLGAPEGGLYAAEDADSDGVEGLFYVWTPAEIRRLLGEQDAATFMSVYGVVEGGNWRDPHGHGPAGTSILHRVREPDGPEETAAIERARRVLFEARRGRVRPGLDDKILAGWNGLALGGLAETGRVLGDAAIVARAERLAIFLLDHMVDRSSGRLHRTFKAGQARLPGTLEDHAYVADGMIALYEATGRARWLDEALRLTELCLVLFHDRAQRAFFVTATGDPGLIERPASVVDGAVPSGMSVCLENLIRLGTITGREAWLDVAADVLAAHQEQATANPFGMSNLLCAMDLLQEGCTEVVLVDGDGPERSCAALGRAVASSYLPNRVIVHATGAPSVLAAVVADKRAVRGQAAAYVCARGTCEPPQTEPESLRSRLRETSAAS